MNGIEFQEKYGVALQIAPEAETVPIKVVTPDGDILEIKEVKFFPLNGGEIHIVAEEFDD